MVRLGLQPKMDLEHKFEGGRCAYSYICSGSAGLISFKIISTSKEINQAEHEYMNMHLPTN